MTRVWLTVAAAAFLLAGCGGGGGTTTVTVNGNGTSQVVGFGLPINADTFGDVWVTHGATSVFPLLPNNDNAQPMLLLSPITFNAIDIKVATPGPGSHVRVAIYQADSSWYPTKLVVDGGALDTSSAGIKTASFSKIQIPAGRYILMANADKGDVACVAYDGPDPFGPVLASSSFITRITHARSYAAFPDRYPGGGWTTITGTLPFRYFVFPDVISSP